MIERSSALWSEGMARVSSRREEHWRIFSKRGTNSNRCGYAVENWHVHIENRAVWAVGDDLGQRLRPVANNRDFHRQSRRQADQLRQQLGDARIVVRDEHSLRSTMRFHAKMAIDVPFAHCKAVGNGAYRTYLSEQSREPSQPVCICVFGAPDRRVPATARRCAGHLRSEPYIQARHEELDREMSREALMDPGWQELSWKLTVAPAPDCPTGRYRASARGSAGGFELVRRALTKSSTERVEMTWT